MSMLQKLGRFVVGGSGATKDPLSALRQAYGDAINRLVLLDQHAELAPQEYGRQGLAALAASAREQVDRIRNFLRQRGVGLPPGPQGAVPAASLNHWARLLQDLELHRASTRRLRELSNYFADTDLEVSRFLQELCREDSRSCERLRTLIARADPQALN